MPDLRAARRGFTPCLSCWPCSVLLPYKRIPATRRFSAGKRNPNNRPACHPVNNSPLPGTSLNSESPPGPGGFLLSCRLLLIQQFVNHQFQGPLVVPVGPEVGENDIPFFVDQVIGRRAAGDEVAALFGLVAHGRERITA